jgi:hypothetical protein
VSAREREPAAPAAAEAEITVDALPVAPVERVALPSGRAVEVTAHGGLERLRVVGRGGRVELSVVLTDAGPRLVFESADVEIKSVGAVTVDCERFAVTARSEASLRAEEVRVEATRGDVAVRANDAVKLDGEEVLMNCDEPDAVPPWMKGALGAELTRAPAAPAADVQGDPTLLEEWERRQR